MRESHRNHGRHTCLILNVAIDLCRQICGTQRVTTAWGLQLNQKGMYNESNVPNRCVCDVVKIPEPLPLPLQPTCDPYGRLVPVNVPYIRPTESSLTKLGYDACLLPEIQRQKCPCCGFRQAPIECCSREDRTVMPCGYDPKNLEHKRIYGLYFERFNDVCDKCDRCGRYWSFGAKEFKNGFIFLFGSEIHLIGFTICVTPWILSKRFSIASILHVFLTWVMSIFVMECCFFIFEEVIGETGHI